MAKFTGGHMLTVAGVLARSQLSKQDHASLVREFERLFAKSNPQFDSHKFVSACSQGNALTITHTQFEHEGRNHGN